MLVRNYNEDIGASIADSFGTDDRAAVERYCASQGITCEWQPDGGLRTSQVRSAIVTHPQTDRCRRHRPAQRHVRGAHRPRLLAGR